MAYARRLLAAVFCLGVAGGAWAQARSSGPVTAPPMQQIIPLEATVNGAKGGTWPFVDRLGVLHVPRDALEEWRIQVHPDAQSILVRGTEYWPLDRFPGFFSKVNLSAQSIEINFAPEAFAATSVSTLPASRPPLSPVLPSAFLNYDLNFSASRSRLANSNSELGALVEAGVSNGWGVLTSSHVGRNLAGQQAQATAGWVRLETTFTRDLPQFDHTLRIGDASTRPGLWGRSLYFGGVQYGSNYALTPGFLAQPVPVLSGTSSSPSTVELYVNDVLRQVATVPSGPFAIDNAALQSGGGEARLVVRDILGRETVIVQPFFTNAQLLAAGLNDWSVEAGALRRDLGTADASYGPAFASATWRRGLSNSLTVEGRSELARNNQVLGLGGVAGLPGLLLGRAALAHSRHDSAGAGSHWQLGLERQWLRSSARVQVQGATSGFRMLGESAATRTKLQLAASASHGTERFGNVSVSVAAIQRFDGPRLTTVSANYSVRLKGQATLSAYVTRAVGQVHGSSFGISLNVPLDKSRQLGASVSSHGGATDAYVTAAQSPDAESELGWRVLAGALRRQAHTEGGVYYTGRYGRLFGDLSASREQTGLRAGMSGGLVAADGHVFATRRVDQSFAVAEVAGHGGVGIGLGSNVLTRTDAAGAALIPQLSPFQANSIRVDPKELPISAEIGSIEQIVVPRWRSAVKAAFPVRSGVGALVKLRLDDDDVAPAGAVVRIDGDAAEFHVARRGEAFVTGLQPRNRLVLTWKDQSCTMELSVPPVSGTEIARLGPLHCGGVKR